MSDAKLIDSAGIPQFTGNLEQLELDSATLTAEAILFRVDGALVHSNFQGLSAFYQAPEAEELFATTAPVATKTDAFADDLEKVSQALTAYGDEVRPLAARLKSLQSEASSFYCNDVAGDEDWREDKDKVQHNNDLWHDVNTTMDAFWAAERACHNKITALVGGIQLKAGDGESSCGTYGYKAEDLNHAESTPWGAPVDREYTGWAAVGHNIKSFVWDGFIIDGVVGTIKGLGTLVGTDGWAAAGQAWTGLAKLATGLAITLSPAGAAYWMAPKDKLPSWLRDSRTAVTETGKALIAYDQWGKNPARAAGAVSFNVITTVATGGAGAAAKSGAAAKAISVAGKAGRLVDPITYLGKAGKLGAVKVGDLFGSLKNLNTGTYNDILSGQGRLQPDGTVVKIPDRVEILPDNTLKYVTDKGETRYLTREGALLDENHKVLVQHVEQVKIQSATPERVGEQADTPAPRDPVREPAMAGARAGEGAAGAVGRAGDDLPGGTARDASQRADSHVPGGSAGDLGRSGTTGHDTPAGSPHNDPPARQGGTGAMHAGEGQGAHADGTSHETPEHAGSDLDARTGPGTETGGHGPGEAPDNGPSGPMERGGEAERKLRESMRGIPKNNIKPKVLEKIVTRLGQYPDGREIADIITSGKLSQKNGFRDVVSMLGSGIKGQDLRAIDQIRLGNQFLESGLREIEFEVKNQAIKADIDVRVVDDAGHSYGYQMKRLDNPKNPLESIAKPDNLGQLSKSVGADTKVMLVDGQGKIADWEARGIPDELLQIHRGEHPIKSEKGRGILFVLRLDDGTIVIPPGSKVDPRGVL
ncbi:hypothetical protein ACFQ7F_02405 [Streptomyces sp. NPDC056486]|uniref:hypothetical protein n=1 Tax=Streptomyces sp. NPDC056486 TaxID=3345835 RepID=UPI0036CFC4F9